MATTRTRKRSSSRRPETSLGKPRGVLHPRVQQVGPGHFGIVCFDCAKARSKFLLADFYGRVLIPPTTVAHARPDLDAAVAQVRAAFTAHQLADGLIAIERTGRYHRIVQRSFAAAGFETRILHPFVTKQYRQPVDPGNKTDDTDLSAIHRATVTGCALLEATRDEAWTSLLLLIRQRRDLVRKGAALNCQIRDHLEASLPGFAACFDDLWESPIPWHLLQHFPGAELLQQAGLTTICQSLRQASIRFQQRTVQAILDWAVQAAPGDVAADLHRRIALDYYLDRRQKSQEIRALERDIASRLVQTPYILLLSFPGINVVSAADFAGEMGPIEHYANAKAITGRAGLKPSRYQSDQVDKANGPLVRNCNRSLRAAILGIADNLIGCNHHFRALAAQWRSQGKDPRPYPRQGGLAVLSHRLPDGGWPTSVSPPKHPGPSLHPRQTDGLSPRPRHRHGRGATRPTSRHRAGSGTRTCSRSQAAGRGTAKDPRRSSAWSSTAWGHPAGRVGTPGDRRDTIGRVRGVGLS